MIKTVPELVSEIRTKIQCITAEEGIPKCQQLSGLLIDVSEPSEFSNKAACGAINIPRGVLEMKLSELCLDPDKPIFLYCATGGRASFSAEQLQRIGFRNVWAITCKCDVVIDTI